MRVKVVVGAVIAAAVVAALLLFVRSSERLPDGPVDVAWDAAACAHCRMHVGEPAFAVQVQLDDGQVLHFDDPGCWLLHELPAGARVHATWLHHVREERWLAEAEAGFVTVSPSPMGYGWAAVDRTEPGAVAAAALRADVLARAGGAP